MAFNAVTALTANDINYLTTNNDTSAWYNAFRKEPLTRPFQRLTANQDFVTYAGKITFNHNPSNGKLYNIRVDKGPGSVVWKWLLQYPGSSVQQTLVDVNNCGSPPIPIYPGTVKVGRNVYWSCSANFRINESTYTAFTVDCTGLKPRTNHVFKFDGVQYNDIIQRFPPDESILNDNEIVLDGIADDVSQNIPPRTLLSSASGKISFIVFVPIKYNSWLINELMPVGGINSTGITKPTVGSTGYSSLEISDNGNSLAKIVIPNRLPNKVLPQDPNGNV